MKAIFVLAGVMILVLGVFFGIGYSDFADKTCNDTPVITFLYNDSFSGLMPISPGYSVIINTQDEIDVALVKDNCWIFYTVTEDGFRNHNYSKECFE